MRSKVENTGLYQERATWILPVGEGVIDQVRIDFAFTIVIDGWINIRINTSFTLTRDGQTSVHDPEDVSSLRDLGALHQQRVEAVHVRQDGLLRVKLNGGGEIRVESDPQYEAYMITAKLQPVRRQFTFVALPGGGLARL